MKTHINQIFTVVSFFSLSLTTTLAITWGINGLISEEKIVTTQCLEQNNAVIEVIKDKDCKIKNISAVKMLTPKIISKSNG